MAAKSLDWKAVVKSTGLRLVVMMVGLYLVSGILEPNYLQPSHIMSTLVLCCFWGIICIGQTLIILTGGADLSVAYSVTFSACVFAQTTKETGNGWIGFAAAMLVGVLMGLFKGVGVAYLKITPMVMTLATKSLPYADQRIKLYFGGGYGLHVESQPGEWTRVDVYLPLQPYGEYQHDFGTDR